MRTLGLEDGIRLGLFFITDWPNVVAELPGGQMTMDQLMLYLVTDWKLVNGRASNVGQ